MARIIDGELTVLPDGRLVPAVEPGARAPLADLHEMLSPHLADEVAAATLDLRDALPRHVLSRNILQRPAGFARDVERLGRLVSLHVTLAEMTLSRNALTVGLERSPLARFSPYAALALQLPVPPAEKLDAFLGALALEPEDEEPAAACGSADVPSPPALEPDAASSSSAFSIPECLERIRAALPALRNLDPRRALRSGLAPRFFLASRSASVASNPSGPNSPASATAASNLPNSSATASSRPGPQPSLAVLAPLSFFSTALGRGLGAIGFERFAPDPLPPRASERWLHEFLAASVLELLYRRSGRRAAPAGFAPCAHAPP